jgi:hypothetical protein
MNETLIRNLDHWIVNSEARGMTHNDLHLHNIMLDSKSWRYVSSIMAGITLPSVQVADYKTFQDVS